jgi:hypothetical protein
MDAVQRRKEASPGFRQVSESADALFTPSTQMRLVVPVMSAASLLTLVMGAFYVQQGATGFGWSVIVIGLLGAALAVFARRVFQRRLQNRLDE